MTGVRFMENRIFHHPQGRKANPGGEWGRPALDAIYKQIGTLKGLHYVGYLWGTYTLRDVDRIHEELGQFEMTGQQIWANEYIVPAIKAISAPLGNHARQIHK